MGGGTDLNIFTIPNNMSLGIIITLDKYIIVYLKIFMSIPLRFDINTKLNIFDTHPSNVLIVRENINPLTRIKKPIVEYRR